MTTDPSKDEDGEADLPLAGMRVVEISSYIASPLAGMVLAQLGAHVVRIDPLGGAPDRRRWPLAPNGESLYWAGLNKGKWSVTADLRSTNGRRLVADIVEQSGPGGGIVLTNARDVEELGLESLRKRRPDLIHVQLIGRPDGGSSVDYTANARSGFAMVTGPSDASGPINHVVPVWDVTAGLYLAIGILAAERRRARTGQGQSIRVALDDVALATAGNLGLVAEAALSNDARPRMGNQVYGDIGRDFRTSDGVHVMLVVITARQWREVVRVLDLGAEFGRLAAALAVDLEDERQRYRLRHEINAILESWFADRTYDDVDATLRPTSLLWSRFRSFAEIVTDDVGGGIIAPVDQREAGSVLAAGSPLVLDGVQLGPARAPSLGEHTSAVLRQLLDLSGAGIDELRERGVVT